LEKFDETQKIINPNPSPGDDIADKFELRLDSGVNGNGNPNSHSDAYAYSNIYPYPYTHSDPNSDKNTHANGLTDTY
jgi:hypothetical protein